MRQNADERIRELARRIYEGDTSLIPALARLHERLSIQPDEDSNEVWLVERWYNDPTESEKWVLATYQDATVFVARLMLDAMEVQIHDRDSTDGWRGDERFERAWKQARATARRSIRHDDYVAAVEAFQSLRTDLVFFARNGVRFVADPHED